jgi:serine/threonine protein kinase
VLKVSDFGLARNEKEGNSTFTQDGPVKWTAPEALDGSYTFASDVWSYGVAIWELATGLKPFNDLTGAQVRPLAIEMRGFVVLKSRAFSRFFLFVSLLLSVARCLACGRQAAVAIARGTRLPRPSPELVPDAMWLLLTRCWRANASERPTTDKLISDLSAILADDARK